MVVSILTKTSIQGLLISISTVLSEMPTSKGVKLYFYGIKRFYGQRKQSVCYSTSCFTKCTRKRFFFHYLSFDLCLTRLAHQMWDKQLSRVVCKHSKTYKKILARAWIFVWYFFWYNICLIFTFSLFLFDIGLILVCYWYDTGMIFGSSYSRMDQVKFLEDSL